MQLEVGVIGLGLLGRALAARLVKAGYAVCGYDLSARATERARERGVEACTGLDDLARRCAVLLLSLPDSKAREELLWGAQNFAPLLSPRTLLLDTTTGRPEDTVCDHERLAAQQVTLTDVCIVGSSQQAGEGTVTALVGAAHTEEVDALLRSFARDIFYLDAPGQANRMKLVINCVLGLNRLVLAEGLALAAKCGFDLESTLDILRAGAAYSRVMDSKGEKMIQQDFMPQARLAQHAKDVSLILELAERHRASTPLSALHHELLERAKEQGLGELDNCAVIKLFLK